MCDQSDYSNITIRDEKAQHVYLGFREFDAILAISLKFSLRLAIPLPKNI